MWEIRDVCKILVGKPDKRSLGEPKRIQEDNTKMCIKDIEEEGEEEIYLVL